MKRILLSLIFFFPLFSFAQNDWAPVGAKWWYGEYDIWVPAPEPIFYYTTESVSNTVVQGINVREISANLCSFCENSCYIYSDSNRVYYYNSIVEAFFLLYDMNLGPGESYNIYYCDGWSTNNCNLLVGEEFPEYFMDSIIVTVVDTSSIIVNGVRLKTQQVSIESLNYQGGFSEEIIERVGNTFSFFPLGMGTCDKGFDELRCYQDTLLGLYHYSLTDCEFTDVGINESNLSTLEIYPNPAQDFRYLKTNSPPKDLNYKILDNTGRTLLSGKTEKEVNVQTLSPGYYRIVFEGEANRGFIKL